MRINKKDLYWIRSGFFTVTQNLSGVLFSFGSFYLLVRLLDKHSYGAWALFMSTITVMEFVRNGLTQSALIKYLSSSEQKDHSQIISASFTISGILTLCFILINICCAHYLGRIWKSPELVPIFYLYNISFFAAGILSQFNCILQANLKFKGVFISSLIMQAAFFAYVLLCFVFHIKIELIHLVQLQILAVCVSTVVSYFSVKPHFSFSFKIYSGWIRKLFNYGKYAFGTSLSAILGSSIDQMMLGAILSPAASGAFNIAVRITNLVDIPINSVATIVFPQSAKLIATEGKDAVKYLYEKSVGAILAVIVPGVLFLFLFSGFVVNLLAGSKYAEASHLLHVTLLYCILTPYLRQFGNILDSIGKTKTNFRVVVITTVINIVLNYLFITRIGLLGAAYATLCSTITGFIIGQIILRKELNIEISNTFIYAFRFYPEFFRKYIKPQAS